MDAPRSGTWFGWRVAVVAGVFLLIGVALGVVLDRTVPRFLPKGATRPPLVGRWGATEHGEPLVFHADGTFERQMAVFDMREGGGWSSKPVLGQWRWLEDDWIELNSFGQKGDKARVVINGDVLKLLREDGDVREYRRK